MKKKRGLEYDFTLNHRKYCPRGEALYNRVYIHWPQLDSVEDGILTIVHEEIHALIHILGIKTTETQDHWAIKRMLLEHEYY